MPAFAATIEASRTDLLRLARGMENGRRTWYYVRIEPKKFLSYQRKMRLGETVNLREYGEVLYSGWGDNPPPEITRKVLESYES